MKKYLLDTNICIFYLNGLFELNNKIKQVGDENCYISEITLAELKFGVENSEHKKKNQLALNKFIANIKIVPIFNSFDLYAKEKSRLRKEGNIIDDFDLLIGVTSVSNEMILVTNNYKHLERIKNIKIEDWTKSTKA
ncbi:MAG: type II toxin-antitoxin system VapC family toxin [Bacteroidetes bacterium]|nr:type II toxin-antitoxin system VapC family toxin [Bacteroidota bacterium]MBL7104359.1 type II toxin-antitoxin system VapC family toxin [Bacteroidales bacterium]